MNRNEQTMPVGRGEWWGFLLAELPMILKKDPRVVQYIEKEFEHPDLLGFVCLEDICAQNYYTTSDLISSIVHMFESYDWSTEDNRKMEERFLLLKEEVIRLQADREDHSQDTWLRSRPFYSDAMVQPEDRLDMDDFTVHTYNVLIRSGIKSVDQLKSISEEQLQSSGSFRARTLQEVLEYRRCMLQADYVTQTEKQDEHDE